MRTPSFTLSPLFPLVTFHEEPTPPPLGLSFTASSELALSFSIKLPSLSSFNLILNHHCLHLLGLPLQFLNLTRIADL